MTDLFRVLGVSQDVSTEDLKAAFRKQALAYHPDRHVHSTEAVKNEAAAKFKVLSEAYEVLSNDQKRTAYKASMRMGHSYGGSTYSHQGVSTDYARANPYAHHSRISLWRLFQRSLGASVARRVEFVILCGLAGGALALAANMDNLWKYRNEHRGFKAMMQRREKGVSESMEPS